MIRFHIPGPPVAKARARVLRSGRSYTPAKTAKYAARVAEIGRLAMGDDAPMQGPVELVVRVGVVIAKSWPAKKREAARCGSLRPLSKPDVDNFAKQIMDALNGVLWRDDSQVIDLRVVKFYAVSPGVTVEAAPV